MNLCFFIDQRIKTLILASLNKLAGLFLVQNHLLSQMIIFLDLPNGFSYFTLHAHADTSLTIDQITTFGNQHDLYYQPNLFDKVSPVVYIEQSKFQYDIFLCSNTSACIFLAW